MIDQGVSAALAVRDANRNGVDNHTSGTGRVAREYTYQDFIKCKPLYFKGTEGVVELTQWFERLETVFRISNRSVENQAIEMATELMDKRVSTMAERQAENKRKFENTSRNNQNQQQQQNKKQNTGRAYTTGLGDKKPYGGSRPLCPKCNYHHE
ncbi:hypothetical protein Tco_0042762, partial [Tanacetum coccineum]